MTFAIGCGLTVVATALAVLGRTKGPELLHFVGKPLILPPLFVAIFVLPSVLPGEARAALAVALTLAWIGDIALMFRRGFMLGLVSFLCAHLAYLVCFSLESAWTWGQLVWLLAVVPFAILGVRGALPHLGKLKLPVIIYATALTFVAWRLLVRFDGLSIAGGALFVLADSLLVRRRFAAAKIPYWLELGTYAASQVCIVAATLKAY